MLEFSLFIPLSAKMGALLNRFTFFVLVICFAAYDDRDKFPPKQRHHLCVMSFFAAKNPQNLTFSLAVIYYKKRRQRV